MDALWLILLVALAVFLLWRYARPSARPSSEEARWEEQVLRLTRDNRGAMERAVMAQRRKFPQESRAQLLRRVHEQYVKDRE